MKYILSFYAVLSVVVCYYDENSNGSPYPWSHGVAEYNHADDWWYDVGGHNSQASDYLAATSPYYSWFKNAQMQYDMFAPALHVGKINRGKFQDPQLNLPADRAFGHNSDFYIDDFVSEAFEYRPQGQKILATKVDVEAGVAKNVGEVIKLPLPVYVKSDGTLLVQAFGGNRANPRDACTRNPNPCSSFTGRPRCIPIDIDTVKCMGPVNTKIELRWKDPKDDDTPNVVLLYIFPAKSDGTECPDAQSITAGSSGSNRVCGVSHSGDELAWYPTTAKVNALLTTQSDGSSPLDYSYGIYAIGGNHNLNEGSPQLIVSDDTYGSMRAVQIITVPQGSSINTNNKKFFFFGCWYSSTKRVNMTRAGFYSDPTVGLNMSPVGVCNVLRHS